MPFEVIGAGFGRTGTLSLKGALEQLGFGPCYHMYELLSHLDHAPIWLAASAGEPVDWSVVFGDYRATVDWPACAFWAELHAAYPDAKVLLSVRPPERWYASFHDTIYQVMIRPLPESVTFPPELLNAFAVGQQIVQDRSFGPDFAELDRDGILAAYEGHNAAVRAGVPAAQLLEFDVAEGWDPLCAFLGVDVPDTEFPNVNDRAMFRQLFGLDTDDEVQAERLAESKEAFEGRFRDAEPG